MYAIHTPSRHVRKVISTIMLQHKTSQVTLSIMRIALNFIKVILNADNLGGKS